MYSLFINIILIMTYKSQYSILYIFVAYATKTSPFVNELRNGDTEWIKSLIKER